MYTLHLHMLFMKLLLIQIGLFIFSPTILFAQNIDSIHTKTDSTTYSILNISKQQNSFLSKPIVKSLITPTIFIGYGLSALKIDALKQLDYNIKENIQKNHPYFFTSIDNYLQYSPAIAVYGLNAAGVHGKHDIVDRSILYGLSIMLYSATDFALKKITQVQRPDGSGLNSFPSGHTTTAFAAAEFLHQEYKNKSVWFSIAGYTIAATTGVLRMYNNKHWLSDVVAGAGIGILATKAAYWIYPVIKNALFKHKQINKQY